MRAGWAEWRCYREMTRFLRRKMGLPDEDSEEASEGAAALDAGGDAPMRDAHGAGGAGEAEPGRDLVPRRRRPTLAEQGLVAAPPLKIQFVNFSPPSLPFPLTHPKRHRAAASVRDGWSV